MILPTDVSLRISVGHEIAINLPGEQTPLLELIFDRELEVELWIESDVGPEERQSNQHLAESNPLATTRHQSAREGVHCTTLFLALFRCFVQRARYEGAILVESQEWADEEPGEIESTEQSAAKRRYVMLRTYVYPRNSSMEGYSTTRCSVCHLSSSCMEIVSAFCGQEFVLAKQTSAARRPSTTFHANVVNFIVRTIWGPDISIVS